MLNLSVMGDKYVVNITLPRNNFNDELLRKVVGLTHKSKTHVSSSFCSSDIKEIHRLTEKLLYLFKLLDYGTR